MSHVTELDITNFFINAVPFCYSASVAEMGDNAGEITWENAVDDHDEFPLLTTDEQRAAFRKFVRSSGGWSQEEIDAWSDVELNALLIQWISGDMREAGLDTSEPDWDQYELDCQEGLCAGRLFKSEDGRVFFDMQE